MNFKAGDTLEESIAKLRELIIGNAVSTNAALESLDLLSKLEVTAKMSRQSKPEVRIWTLDEYRKAIGDYLRMGMVVICPRQVGKTTALLQLAREMLLCGEQVTIQVPTDHMAHVALHMWHGKYPAQRAPVFTHHPRFIVPKSRVLIDEYCRVSQPYGDFYAATDSLPGAFGAPGLDTAERARKFGMTDHVRVILPMFTTGEAEVSRERS